MNQMKQQPCPDLELLSAWLEGSLPPAERSGVTAHLATCDDCRRAVAIASAVPPQAPAQVDEALVGRILQQTRRRPKAWTWAAAAAALVAAGVTFWAVRPTPVQPEMTAVEAPASSTPAPVEARGIPLPDPRPEASPTPKAEPRTADLPRPAKPTTPGLPEEPRESIVIEEPEKRTPSPTDVPKPPPASTVTDLSRVFTPVFVLDATPDLWLKRSDAAVGKAASVERVAWRDTFSAAGAGAGFALEGKASVALDKGAQASVSRYHDAYAMHLVEGAVLVDTEGADQHWHLSHGRARVDVPALNGRLAVEPRSDGAFAAVLLEGKAEFKLGAEVHRPAPGREILAPVEGPLTERAGDPRRFVRLTELRPRYLTAFAANFDEREASEAPFAYTLLSGRRSEEGKWIYLHADGTDATKPGEKAVFTAGIRPERPIVHSTGMMLFFRYRTDLGPITIKLGKFTAVFTSSARAGQWGEAKIPLETFQEEGVRMVPSDEVTDVRFLGSAAYEKKGGRLDIDGVQFLRRAR